MNNVKNTTELAEKRYRDKLRKNKTENRINIEKHKKQNKKVEKLTKFIKSKIISYRKQKTQQHYQRKSNMK